MSQCPTCGSNVPDQDSLCPQCGMDMSTPQTQGTSPEVAPPAPAPSPEEPVADPVPEVPLPAPAPASEAIETSAEITLKRSGALTADSFVLGGRAVLGRFDPETGPVDVDFGPLPEAAYISRRHAEVWRSEDGAWFVKDLGSHNGTFVKQADQTQFLRLSGDQALGDGDEIALGNARFEFHIKQ